MSRKSSQEPAYNNSDNSVNTAEETKQLRTRTHMHTVRIIAPKDADREPSFIVLLNGKATAQFTYYPASQTLDYNADKYGSYEGFSSYYRKHTEEFDTILITKAVDLDVVSAQSDRFTAEQFIRSYIDRKTIRAQAVLTENEPDTTPDTTGL